MLSPMRQIPRFALLVLAFFMISACSTNSAQKQIDFGPEISEFFEANNLTGKSAQEIVDHLEQLNADERPKNFLASVGARELKLVTQEQEIQLDLPASEFYISVAPFREQTHPCTFHSLTTCQGELPGEEFDVEIVDSEGETILSQRVTSFENGFIGLWLPRNIQGEITITDRMGESGTVPFTTDDSGITCITELQLEA